MASNYHESELTKNLLKVCDELSKLLEDDDVSCETVSTSNTDDQQNRQLEQMQGPQIPVFPQMQPLHQSNKMCFVPSPQPQPQLPFQIPLISNYYSNANAIQQNSIRFNQGNPLIMTSGNTTMLPTPPSSVSSLSLSSNISANYVENDIEAILPKLSEINFDGFYSSAIKPVEHSMTNDRQRSVLTVDDGITFNGTVNAGPSNSGVNASNGAKPKHLDAIGKTTRSETNLVQNYYLPLIRKFHRIYMALDTLRNERNNLKNLLQLNKNGDVINDNVRYEMPQTNQIKTLVELTEEYVTLEFNEMRTFFEQNEKKFDENTMQIICSLLHDFRLKIIKLSEFRCFTLSLTDNLKALLDVLLQFIRYCCISYLILQHQIKTKSRGIQRNVGV